MEDNYWQLRAKERDNMEHQMRKDAGFKGNLTTIYNDTREEIDKEVATMLERFADAEGLSMAKARQTIDKTDVERYQGLAEQIIAENRSGKVADRQLRRHNVTQQTSHMELLSARMNLQTVKLADEEAYRIQKHLMKEYLGERERMSGVLGELSGLSEEALRRNAEAVVFAEFRGTTFSERVWEDQFELQNSLEQTIRRSIMRGQNPRNSLAEIKKSIDKEFKNKKYAADRIAITEVARVQGEVQKESYNDAGYDKYQYIAEEGACDECGELHDEVFLVSDMSPGENMYPMHPFCRCATIPYSDEFDQYMAALTGDPADEPEQTGSDRKYETVDEAFNSVNLDGNIDPEFKGKMEDRFLDLANRYDVDTESIELNTVKANGYFGYNAANIEGVEPGFARFKHEIAISETLQKNQERSLQRHKDNYRGRRSPLELLDTDGMTSLTHEFGHAIDDYYRTKKYPQFAETIAQYATNTRYKTQRDVAAINKFNNDFNNPTKSLGNTIFKKVQKEMGTKNARGTWEVVEKDLGSYAASNYSEYLAEGFTAMEYGHDSDHIRLFKKYFDEEMASIRDD